MRSSRLQCFLGSASLADGVGDTGSKVVRLGAACCLGIDTHRIFRATCTGKASALVVAGLEGLDLGLEAWGRLELALGIVSLEDGAVCNLHANKSRGKVGVSSKPFLGAPALVSKNSFDQEHVGDGITDRLVDQVSKSLEALKGALLGRRLGLSVLNGLQGGLGESNGTVTVGLEVDANVEAQGRMVQMLNTSVGANRRQLQDLLDVVRAGTIGVSGLDDADLELLRNSSAPRKITDEGGRKGGNAVTVKQSESVALVDEVVHDTIGVTIQRGTAVKSSCLGGRRGTLFRFDIIGTTLETSQYDR